VHFEIQVLKVSSIAYFVALRVYNITEIVTNILELSIMNNAEQ